MISTGLQKLDTCLGGGLKEGLITDIFGQNATGKSQLAFQICINALKSGKEVLFEDTTGGFRPERLVEMIGSQNMDLKILDKIYDVLIRIEKHLLKYEPKEEKKKKQLLND